MPAPRTTTTDHAHQVAAQAIASAESGCRGISQSVSAAQGTLAGGWTGGASTAYGSAVTSWLEKLNQLITSLDGFGEALSGTRNAMTAQEDDATTQSAAWARVNI
ncbi:WXG100 family type VII secretion target [Streptomyces chartreusis]|uniref:WXG100 family type VII secretion target n=1 Tax=Streptomyces chartreusis TaxID=1969 RepID=UPI00381C89D9